MIFNSAGHHLKDSGAVGVYKGKQIKEADVAILLRNESTAYIRSKGYKVIEDKDTETLKEYLDRIQTGSGSVVIEHHLDAFTNNATGITVIVRDNPTKESMEMAKEMAQGLHKVTGLVLRSGDGVITEKESNRGKLGLMRESGTVILIEHGFISNPKDIEAIMSNLGKIAQVVGDVAIKYENKL